jgi:hypothetical protein
MKKMAAEDNSKVYQNFQTALDKTKKPTLMASNSRLLMEASRVIDQRSESRMGKSTSRRTLKSQGRN